MQKKQKSEVRGQMSKQPPFPNPLSGEEMERVSTFLNAGSCRVEEKPEHWISGYDESESFCPDCMDKKIEELRKANPETEYLPDGGWSTEGDSIAYCETCECRLFNSLTAYGCEEEVNQYSDYGFDMSDGECANMDNVISSRGWTPWLDRNFRHKSERKSEIDYFAQLHALGRRILAKLDDPNFQALEEKVPNLGTSAGGGAQ